MNTDSQTKKLAEEKDNLVKLCSIKADMVSISAHQIRTALSAQKWIMKMFLDGDLGKLNTEQENLMRKAYDSNDRAISVIKELMLANKTEEIRDEEYTFTKLDLMELINNTIFDFSGEAHSLGIEIILLKPEELHYFTVKADKEKIRIVLQNLLENSIKYSNRHGKIFVSVIQIDNVVQVSIKDTGVGISEDGKKKIFEKFFRDSEAQKKEILGSGIGLFTSKKIIENHGGKIWFDSREKEGTTFFFTIPISE